MTQTFQIGLQERLLDQIHAGEFNLGEDMRTAEVGSVLPADYAQGSFQRIDDTDISDRTSGAPPGSDSCGRVQSRGRHAHRRSRLRATGRLRARFFSANR